MGSERTAAGVFGLLSDEIRLDVLRAIAVAQTDATETGVAELSFSDIYDRIDVDNTSKLSYHLGELTGTFLRETEGGYAFTHAGERLVRFVLAENYRQPPDFGPVDTEGRCLHCDGTSLQAVRHAQFFFVRCADCDRPAFAYRVRPAQVAERTGAALVDAVVGEQAGDFLKMRAKVCPDCSGRIETTLTDAAGESVPDSVPVDVVARNECQQCLRFMSMPLTHAAVYHPEAISFHWDHGVDVLSTGFWQFHEYVSDGRWTASSAGQGPGAYRVEYEAGDATLRLFLDAESLVTRAERVRRRDH
jgi:hypothetical protein